MHFLLSCDIKQAVVEKQEEGVISSTPVQLTNGKKGKIKRTKITPPPPHLSLSIFLSPPPPPVNIKVVVLRGAKDRLVGVASMRLFDANGALNMGLQKRPFLFTAKAPFSWDPAAPPSGREPGEDGVWCGSGGSSGGDNDGDERALSKEDLGFALERVRDETFCCSLLESQTLHLTFGDLEGGAAFSGRPNEARLVPDFTTYMVYPNILSGTCV